MDKVLPKRSQYTYDCVDGTRSYQECILVGRVRNYVQ